MSFNEHIRSSNELSPVCPAAVWRHSHCSVRPLWIWLAAYCFKEKMMKRRDWICVAVIEFQFTPPRRGRLDADTLKAAMIEFQFTPPRRGRPVAIAINNVKLNFNSRPREGGDISSGISVSQYMDFNSRPREGGDRQIVRSDRYVPISIHAPAKGATAISAALGVDWEFQFTPPRRGRLCGKTVDSCTKISIHAPAKGATPVQYLL